MIASLANTIIIEGTFIAVYAIWHRKPLKHLLFSSSCANLFTQFLLWIVLNLFYSHYLITLFIAEIYIWGIEATIMYLYPHNHLKLQEAIFLSLMMNLVSFGIGLFLPA